MPHQAAQVDKVFLRGGAFFLGDVAPYGDEFLGGEGGAQGLLLCGGVGWVNCAWLLLLYNRPPQPNHPPHPPATIPVSSVN